MLYSEYTASDEENKEQNPASEEARSRNPMLQAALSYARQGIPVFPLHTVNERGQCSCPKQACSNPGKHPRTAHGLRDSTTSELVIRQWWTRWPSAGVGLRTGVAFVVLDIDDAEGLKEAEVYGVDLHRLHSTTGKGRHYLFKKPDGVVLRNKGKGAGRWPLQHCDARGDGGYIVAAPSQHVSGRHYEWSGTFSLDALPDTPQRLLEVWRDLADDPRNWQQLEDDTDAVDGLDESEAVGGDALGEVTAAYYRDKYTHIVLKSEMAGRNDCGFLLSLQLRDNGISQEGAEPYLRAYQQVVADCRPEKANYTWEEAASSLAQAYSRPAREPASALVPDSHARLDTIVVDILAEPGNELFKDVSDVSWVTVPVNSHHETFEVRSRAMGRWLRARYHDHAGSLPKAETVSQVIDWLDAKAHEAAKEYPVYLRMAQPTLDTIWVDLANPLHQAVHITPDGWNIESQSTVRFKRAKGMGALPLPAEPKGGGTVETLLRPFVNFDETETNGLALFIVWLCAALFAEGPFTILQLHGEQGSAKTTVGRIAQRLIDPSVVGLSGEPREERDLVIAARNSWVLAFDNISHLAPWLPDTLCRLATGGGQRTRTLTTDSDETLFAYKRPVLLTGINEVITQPDLLDRTLSLALKRPATYRTEADFWAAFADAQPAILGALYGVVGRMLAGMAGVRRDLRDLPRMADFYVIGHAVERAMGWEAGTFATAYAATRKEAHEIALEASPIYAALVMWLNRCALGAEPWVGNMQMLLDELTQERDAHPIIGKLYGWPTTPRALSSAVTRLRPSLEQAGITVSFLPHGRRYEVRDGRTADERALVADARYGRYGWEDELFATVTPSPRK